MGRHDANPNDQGEGEKAGTFPLPALVVTLGLTLVVLSFLPFGNLVTHRLWTAADAARYDRVTLEYHKSAYQEPARAGLTQSQWQARHEQLQKEFEALRDKLATTRQQPHTWSQFLLWSGALFALGGGLSYRAAHSKKDY